MNLKRKNLNKCSKRDNFQMNKKNKDQLLKNHRNNQKCNKNLKDKNN